MSDARLIENISDTARWVAYYRAMETERPDAIFRDPFAARLAGDKGRRIVDELPDGKRGAFFLVVRTKAIDEMILHAIREEGIDCVLNLAAGLDTRPYRLDLPSGFRWIEVDFDGILSYKERLLLNETPRCRLERVRQDLLDVSARRRLFARVASKSRKVLVLTEGFILYLEREQAFDLVRDLAAEPAFTQWVTDFVSPELLVYLRRQFGKQLKAGSSEMKFAMDPGPECMESTGWKPVEVRYGWEEARRLKREFRGAWLIRLMMWFSPRAIREKYRKMSGFARYARA